MQIATEIFKAYDIRGIVGKTLTDNSVKLIGQAIAAEATTRGVKQIALGRDGRLSGESLLNILIETLTDAGIDVINLGMVATPMLYFAAHTQTAGSGIMITGSHNPPEYNGFKMMLAGETLAGDTIQNLLSRIQNNDFLILDSKGKHQLCDITKDYQDYITNHISLKRPMKIAIDAGNGVAGAFAGNLYRALGCEVIELFCDVDGNFPNHHPDPAKPENLEDLKKALSETDCELGLAFDGDGDRLGVVTKDGQIIWPDRQLMLFAADVLSRHPQAKVIFDVKCTRLLSPWISAHGGIPILSKTGHSFIKAAIREHDALIAGEMSGHLFFKERWFGFDDGLYAGARLLEIVSQYSNPSEILNNLPNGISTPEINIAMHQEGKGHELITILQKDAQFPLAENIITIDGLRVEYADGFGLIRASNTTPVLVLRFEAENIQALTRIQQEFKSILINAGIPKTDIVF